MKTILGMMTALLMVTMLIAPAFGQPVEGDLIADGPDSSFTLVIGDVTVTPVDTDSSGGYDRFDISISLDNGGVITYQYPYGTGPTITTQWYLNETHVHIDDIAPGAAGSTFPVTGSLNPKVGKFMAGEEYSDLGPQATSSATYQLTLDGDFTGTLYVAVQVAVSEWDHPTLVDNDGDGVIGDWDDRLRDESAWATDGDGDDTDTLADDIDFGGKSWAMYFTFTVGTPS